MISVQCESCFVPMDVPEKYGGKKIRCKECGEPVAVPRASAKREAAAVKSDDLDFTDGLDLPSDSDASAGDALPPTIGKGRRAAKGTKRSSQSSRRGLAALWDSWMEISSGKRTAILAGLYLACCGISLLSSTVLMTFVFGPMVLGLLTAFFGFAWVIIEKLFRGARQNPLGLLLILVGAAAGFSPRLRVSDTDEVDTFSEFGGNIMKVGAAMFAVQLLAMIVLSGITHALGIEVIKKPE